MSFVQQLRTTYWKYREICIYHWRSFLSPIKALVSDVTEQVLVLCLIGWFTRTRKAPESAMTLKRHILFVTHYAPPYASVLGTQRLTKFTKFWARAGWTIDLLTSWPQKGDPVDEQGESLHPDIRVTRIAPTRKTAHFIPKGFFVPDDYFRWVRPAVQALAKLIQSERPDVIVATVPPYSNALAAAICAGKFAIPLVTDFRDPWTRIGIWWVIKHAPMRWLNAWMERRVLESANLIFIADDLTHLPDLLPNSERWKNKTISITNGYDEEDFISLKNFASSHDSFRISYVGTIYDAETWENLLAPLREWGRRHPEDMRFVRFVYAGSSSIWFKEAENLPCTVEDHGFVSHREAIMLRIQSNVQLFCLPSHFKSHTYSGKIFEMLRTPVPILAITKADSAPARLLRETGTGVSVTPGDAVAGAMELKAFFDNWRNGEIKYEPRTELIKNYSREHLSMLALQAIENIIIPRKTFNAQSSDE